MGLVGAGQASSSYIEHTLYQTLLVSKPIVSYSGGVVIRHYNDLNPLLKVNSAIQGGIIFTRKGWKQDLLLAPADPITELNYITIPIDGIIYWGDESRKFQLSIGIFGEYLVSYKIPGEVFRDFVTIEDYYGYEPGRDKSFGYGGTIAMSLFKVFEFGALDFGPYFNYSLSNFINIERRADPLPDTSNLFNIGISLTYLFKIR